MEKISNPHFVIGVDGGGTKTAALLAGMQGEIIARSVSGGSNLRDSGIETAAKNVAKAIHELLGGREDAEIESVFIGLPAVEEEFKDKKEEVVLELKKDKNIKKIFSGEVVVGSDQLVAFRSGSKSENGIVAISGTGSAVHGWNNGKEFLTNNWGWLVSKGSGNWIGLNAAQAIVDRFGEEGRMNILRETVFEELSFKDVNDFLKFVYGNPAGNLPRLSALCDKAANAGDPVARGILEQAGKETALSVCAVAGKLEFSGTVPLVLVGGTFRSKWVLDELKKDVQLCHSGDFEFIIPRDPAEGAVRLALEALSKK